MTPRENAGAIDIRAGAYAVVIETSRILLVRWAEGPVPEWTLPGGGIEPGETAEACAIRETREETGLHIAIARHLGVHERIIPAAQRLSPGNRPLHLHRTYYQAQITGGTLTPASDPGNDRAAWIPLADLPNLIREPGIDAALTLAGYRLSHPIS